MSKFFAWVLLIVFCMSNVALGERDAINISRQAGGVTINFNAEVYGADSATATRYTATPQAVAIDDIIRLIWPSEDISTILATKTERVDGDGVGLYDFETYEYEGDELLWHPNLGMISFYSDTERKNSTDNDYVEEPIDLDAWEQNEDMKTFMDRLIETFSCEQYALFPLDAESIVEKNGYAREHYEFAFELDGIVCNNQGALFAISGSREIPAQYLVLEWDSEGLAYLSMGSYRAEPSEENLAISSWEDAIDALCDYLGMFVVSDTVDIRTIVLSYQMLPVAGEMTTYEYVPVWKLQTSSNAFNLHLWQDGSTYMVNAITGEILEL